MINEALATKMPHNQCHCFNDTDYQYVTTLLYSCTSDWGTVPLLPGDNVAALVDELRDDDITGDLARQLTE